MCFKYWLSSWREINYFKINYFLINYHLLFQLNYHPKILLFIIINILTSQTSLKILTFYNFNVFIILDDSIEPSCLLNWSNLYLSNILNEQVLPYYTPITEVTVISELPLQKINFKNVDLLIIRKNQPSLPLLFFSTNERTNTIKKRRMN